MAQFIEVHPENPQLRLIHRAVDIIRQGGIIAYPTDSSYALACHIGDKQAMDKIRRIRQLDDKHDFTLVCKDLAQISTFTKIGNDAFRLIKALTPGPFTFILEATKEVPRRLQHPKKKTIGIRIPDHAVAHLLVQELEEALLSATLILPGASDSLSDPYEIKERLDHELDLVIDAGIIGFEPTTVIEFTSNGPVIIRQGKGIADMLTQGDTRYDE
ncbi:MAG: L-threonylcarbamoyladenylate synthase [Methylovulum sp.]|nr:L-threonylcarbamoyladenylate synthase [Methylovulum sp.]